MAYTYDPIFAADPNNPATVAKDAAITIFDPADVTMAPVTITDPTGSPLTNPVVVNKSGFGPAFRHATLDRVGWSGGGFTGFFTSYEGMKTVATDAKAAALAAQSSAETAGAAAAASAALVGAPADTAVQTLINTPASATRVKLDATFTSRKPGAYDSFAGKVNAVLTAATKLDSGQTYAVRENIAGVGYAILNGALTHSTGTTTATAAAYAGLDIGERVGRIWAKFTLPAGTAWETLVLVVSTGSFTTPPDFANSASHFVIGAASYSYEVLTASPFATTAIKTGTFDTPLVPGVEYQVSIDFIGDTAVISLPTPVDGYSTAVAVDSRIDTYRGQFATIELYSHTGNANTRIDVGDWGADGVNSIDFSEPHASRADLKQAIDAIPDSGVLPAAPSRVSWDANPAVSVELSTTPVALNEPNLTLSVKFPPSGKVEWFAQFWLWMNAVSGEAETTGYFGVMEGVTFKAGRKTVSATDVQRLYQVSGILTDTPGVTRTYQLGGYAGAIAKINFLSENATGVPADFKLTPLAS